MSDSSDLIPDSALVALPGSQATSSSPSDDLIPPSALASNETIFHPDPNVSEQSDKPIEAGATPLSSAVGAVNKWAGGKLASGAQWAGMTDPRSLQEVRNLPVAAETVLPFLLGTGRSAPPGVGTIEHPLTGAAKSVQADQDAMDAQATAAGFDMQSRTPSPANQVVNRLSRQDLQLPTAAENGIDAPLYPEMLHAGNKQYVSPAFQAAEAYPKPIPLSTATKATLNDVRPMLSTGEVKALPTGDEITSQQGMQLSQTLRARASQIPDIGMNPATNQMWSDIGKAHIDAAKAIEGDMRTQFESDGQGQLADDWHNAVVYRAKSAAYEDALDGAGNVRATVLKNQLVKQDVPLTGNAKMIATVAAKQPEMFKGQPAAPRPGLVRKATAAVAPYAGAAVGGAAGTFIGVPGIGAAGGAILGSHISNVLNP